MLADLLDTIASLTEVTAQETELLAARGPAAALAELSGIKVRLGGQMEAIVARLARGRPEWWTALDVESRGALAAATATLLDAARANAVLLERRIALASDMMAAVAAEAQRLTGARNAVYAADGGLIRNDQPAPISLNARL